MYEKNFGRFPVRRRRLAHFALFLLRAGVMASKCDPACLGHRLIQIGLPLLNDTTVSYWWPGQAVDSVHLCGDGLEMSPYVPEEKRNQWHALVMQSRFIHEDELMLKHIGVHLGGWYTLSIPTLDIFVNVSCDGWSCKNVVVISHQPVTWALGCDDTPCGCPSEAAKGCALGGVQKTGCDILYLNQAGMILDSPSKVFWRPLLLHSKLSFFWGTEDEFAEPYTIVASRQELDTWVTFDIHTRKVEIGNKIVRECNMTIPALDFATVCSVADKAVLFYSTEPAVIALGCDVPPVYRNTADGLPGWAIFVMVLILTGLCVSASCVVRRRRKTQRQGTA
ncbi:uncharacterized protein LOC119577191 [Penaeus monodon]|uniref:uncharacterized protein LOC119577191 n=1 Tax=Penaeus monodon TaxID=6687 RepID=UPI0018A7402D|nr:uncharacterized protein LOC119577191 [Penaeus monodon]